MFTITKDQTIELQAEMAVAAPYVCFLERKSILLLCLSIQKQIEVRYCNQFYTAPVYPSCTIHDICWLLPMFVGKPHIPLHMKCGQRYLDPKLRISWVSEYMNDNVIRLQIVENEYMGEINRKV